MCFAIAETQFFVLPERPIGSSRCEFSQAESEDVMNLMKVPSHSPALHQGTSYSVEDEETVVALGLLDRFLINGQSRDDVSRLINDNLLEATTVSRRTFLVMTRQDGVKSIVAEFMAVVDSKGMVIGPVATSKQPKRSEVLAARNKQLAELLLEWDGKVVAITSDSDWGDEKALEAFGFKMTGAVALEDKARLVALSDGRPARFAHRTAGQAVPLNGGPSFFDRIAALFDKLPRLHARYSTERTQKMDVQIKNSK
jgi:hypothetical protein